MTIFGVDVSAYQGQIDFAVLKTKAQFMYMRGAWAKNEDYYFQRNATEATGHGIPWGVYFVPTPGGAAKSWQVQADYHASLYQTFPGLLPPAIDLEQDGGMDKNDLGNWLEKYYAEFMMKSGAPEAMIYTRAGWFDYEMPLTNTFWRCLLWVADYTPPVSVPKEWSNHGRTYTLHQKGIHKPGSDYGCPEPPLAAAGIDLTDFPGTASQFQDVFGVLPNPLPTTPPPTVGTRVRTKVAINPRTAPRIETATDAGNINAGFTFKKAGEPQNGFQPVEVWLAQAYLTELP